MSSVFSGEVTGGGVAVRKISRTWGSAAALGVVTLVLGSMVPAGAAPAKAGHVPGPPPITSANVGHLHPQWSEAIEDASNDPPVVANGMVYEQSCHESVCAWNEATGAPEWTNQNFGQPWVVDGAQGFGQYYLNGTHGIGSFNAVTGATLWALSIPNIQLLSPPVLSNGTVYFTDGQVWALNAATGALLWQTPTSTLPLVTNVTVGDGSLFVMSQGTLAVLDPATGALEWSGQTDGLQSSGPAVIHDGSVYVTGLAGPASAGLPDLSVFPEAGCGQAICQPTDSERIGNEEVSYVVVSFSGDDEFLAGSDGLEVRNTTTGTSWHGSSTGGWPESLPVVSNDVIFATVDGSLVAYKLDGCGSATCAPIWQTTFSYDFSTPLVSPVVDGSAVYEQGQEAVSSWEVAPTPSHVAPSAPIDVQAEATGVGATPVYELVWGAPTRPGAFPIIGYELTSSRSASTTAPSYADAGNIARPTGPLPRLRVRAITVAGFGTPSKAATPVTE